MFDSQSDGEIPSSPSDAALDTSSDDKLQYTIKGIERRSIELMRDAARGEGMKIGAWVSKRLKEAAVASLSEEDPAYSRNFFAGELTGSKNDFAPDFQKRTDEILVKINQIEVFMQRMHENQMALIAGLVARSSN